MIYSVIIPAHNEAVFLPGLLDSLCAQDHLPVEVILVNDNSINYKVSANDNGQLISENEIKQVCN